MGQRRIKGLLSVRSRIRAVSPLSVLLPGPVSQQQPWLSE
jgi:hypothetical protein